MTPTILLLILLSALLNPWWNYLMKGSRHPLAFLALTNATTTTVLFPAFVVMTLRNPLTAEGWVWFLVTCVFHCMYDNFLAQSYSNGDMVVVYPITRSAPIFVALVARYAFTEDISVLAWIGIVLTVTGIFTSILERTNRADPPQRKGQAPHSIRGVIYAVLAAIGLAGLSLGDKQALKYMSLVPLFGGFIFVSTASLFSVAVLKGAWKSVIEEWRHSKKKWLAASFFNSSSYFLFLISLGLAGAKISYIVGVRQVAAVVGVLFGIAFLKEHYGRWRFASGALVVVGVVFICLAK